MITRVLLGCAALSALTFAAIAEGPRKLKEAQFTPTLIISGSHTAIDRETFAVATDEKAWKALWEKHRGDEKTLRFTEYAQYFHVDFDTQYVVAIFPADGLECLITSRKRGNEVMIGFRANVYGVEGRLPGSKDTRTEHEKAREKAISPYAFVVLPKPVSTVVINKDIRTDKFGTPVWEERKRFPAPKDK